MKKLPEIYLYGANKGNASSNKIQKEIGQQLVSVPCHRDDVVLIIVDSQSRMFGGKSSPFVRIEGSVEMSNDDLISIANHFLEAIDVSMRNGHGIMVFREKGQEFEPGCLDQPEHSHLTLDVIGEQ